MTTNQRLVAWILAGALLAVAAFFAGRASHPGAAPSYAFEQDTPAYTASLPGAGLSQAGFSGFDTADKGATLASGRVVDIDDQAITIESSTGVQLTIQLQDGADIRLIQPTGLSDLEPGTFLVLRLNQDNQLLAGLLSANP